MHGQNRVQIAATASIEIGSTTHLHTGQRVALAIVNKSSVVETIAVQIELRYDARLRKTAAIEDLSYLTYLPLPLSISW